MSHRPTCSFQAVVRNTRNATDARFAIKKPKYATRAGSNRFYHCVRCIFVCVHCVHCSIFFICVAWPACVASVALHTAAWKPTYKSVFIGLQYMRFPNCRMQHMQRSHGLWRNQKTKIRNACMRKKTHAIESILFIACIAIFGVFCVHALRVLRCVRQLGNGPLSPFSAFWRRWLCFNIRHM